MLGGEYKEQTVTIPATITVGKNSSTSGAVEITDVENRIKWYEDAPTYDIVEVEKSVDNKEDDVVAYDYEMVSISPSHGTLEEYNSNDDNIVSIIALNRIDSKKGKIKIIKTLEYEGEEGLLTGTNKDKNKLLTEENLKKLSFVFELKITYENNETETETLTLDKNSIERTEDGRYIWVGESKEYQWTGNAPHYEITETDIPDGIEFLSGTAMSGELKPGTTTVGEVENDVVNNVKSHKGKIHLIKQVEGTALQNKTYRFIVKISGTFVYKGELFEKKTIQLTSDEKGYEILNNQDSYNKEKFVEITVPGDTSQNDWFSDEFTWYGTNYDDVPDYSVEEILIDSDINCSINPSSGKLSNTNENGEVVVTARNTLENDKVGYLHLIKKLTNSENCSAEYIKSLIFKFKIKIIYEDREEEQTIAVEPELRDNSWVWEYKSDKYIWHEGEKTPTYTIEEIEIPEGIEYVSGNTSEPLPLVENNATDVEIKFTEVNYVNNVNEKQGYLEIKKEVTDNSSLNGETFNFTVTLNCTGYVRCEYDEKTYEPTNGIITIPVSVSAGAVEKVGPITWYGDVAPTYIVEEDESNIAQVVSMENETGTIKNGTVTAIIRNGPKKVGGYLSLQKNVVSKDGKVNLAPDSVFYFDITIKRSNGETILQQRVSLKDGEKFTSDYIEWNAVEEAPEYEIKEVEIPNEFEPNDEFEDKESGLVKKGKLEENTTVDVVAKNDANIKRGKFKVTKEIVPDKFVIDAKESYSFDFKVIISGTFMKEGEDIIHYKEDGPVEIENRTITVDVSTYDNKGVPSASFEPDYDIIWWGDEAPTVTVEETKLPEAWRQVGSISNNNSHLKEDETIEMIITNELPTYSEIDLTLKLAGTVWEDEKNTNDGKYEVGNGIFENEQGVKGVEVNVYRISLNDDNQVVHTEPAVIYADNLNSTLSSPIITDDLGYWEAPRVKISPMTEDEKANNGSKIRYYVEFIYDGQTYEPTTFLANGNVEGDASKYMSASTSDRDNYKDLSMAKDINRKEVDNRIQSISGNTAINGKGETTGTVQGKDIEDKDITNNINYEADVTNIESNKKLRSELKTTDESGRVFDVFKAKATTLEGNLTYPFDEHMHLEWEDATLTSTGVKYKYVYSATYDYCLHINLGLVKRETVDLEATKDLVSAKVIVDGKEQEYTFNKLQDVIESNSIQNPEERYYERDLGYELGLYKTDYFYRAEMYKSNIDLYSSMNSYYNSILGTNEGAKDSELDVYLKYKLTLCNYSNNYKVRINEVTDYYDSSFEEPIEIDTTQELVDEKQKKIVDVSSINNSEAGDKAANAYWQKLTEEEAQNKEDKINGTATKTLWQTVDKNINSSDGRTYNKMILKTENLTLERGERAEIYVTFRLRKDNINGVKDTIKLGEKANIVEISSYSTLYNELKGDKEEEKHENAGKIDLDSAAGNVNIEDHNQIEWYEDDTDIAPALKLYLKDEIREVDGIAWEDNKDETASTASTAVGNGVLDDNENVIGGLTTELVEKMNVPVVTDDGQIKREADSGNIEYKVYDFLWPTSEQLEVFGGKTLEYLTGFASTIETLRKETPEFLKDSEGNLITDENNERVVALKAEGYNVQELEVEIEENTEDTEEGKKENKEKNKAFAIIHEVGSYDFNSVPLGDFVVRFLYGNDKTKLEDQTKVNLEPARAMSRSGDFANEEMYVSNYDGDKLGYTAAVYNGQDYKSTIYQVTKVEEKNITGRDSDAKDNEARRLEVIANSQTITNPNGTVLKTANNSKDEIHTELYNQYDMFADTARLIFKLDKASNGAPIDKGNNSNNPNENISSDGETVQSDEQSNELDKIEEDNVTIYAYNNVDFGLIERPENNIVLDKQINEIILKTNDGKVVFDAVYDIVYKEDKLNDDEAKTKTIIKKLDDDNYLYADVTLNTEKSVGIDQLQAIDKNELKPTKEEENSGTQNFRFINVDSEILQGTTLSINYLITALNIGEADYVKGNFAQILDKSTQDFDIEPDGSLTTKNAEDQNNLPTTKEKINKLVDRVKELATNGTLEKENEMQRQYLGNFYDTGIYNKDSGDVIVTTKIRQLVDYVDNDAVFNSTENEENDHIWRNTNITELLGSGLEENRLIDPNVLPVFQKVDKHEVYYLVKQDVLTDPSDPSTLIGKSIQRDNLILSVDDDTIEDTTDNIVKSNAGFERELVPYDVVDLEEDFEYTSSITLTVSKTVAAQNDADNLSYDNIAEIVKYENSVGRRDEAALVGNANPLIGEFKTSLKERDASATELITFTPPTGIETQEVMQTQFLIIVISSLVIVVVGIVIIKKKVLK